MIQCCFIIINPSIHCFHRKKWQFAIWKHLFTSFFYKKHLNKPTRHYIHTYIILQKKSWDKQVKKEQRGIEERKEWLVFTSSCCSVLLLPTLCINNKIKESVRLTLYFVRKDELFICSRVTVLYTYKYKYVLFS